MSPTIYFTPGPTKLHPVVIGELSQLATTEVASKSHRSSWFEKVFAAAVANLKSLLQIPESHVVVFVGSATEVWERFIENCVDHRSFHIINGEFAQRFYAFSKLLGREPSSAEFDPRGINRFSSIAVPADAEALCVTINETSSGMTLPLTELKALVSQRPEVLIAADVVSAVPYYPVPWSLIDCGFFSVQKGFGLPAGLGVVVLNPRAIARAKARKDSGRTIGTYHSFESLVSMATKNQTPETPNVLGIYLLGKVVEDYLRVGITKIRAVTEQRAKQLYQDVPALIAGAPLVGVEEYRSVTSLAFLSSNPVKPIMEKLSKHGIAIGGGYGPFKDSGLRIANFPMHTDSEFEKLLAALKN